jgi:hypothetical protein
MRPDLHKAIKAPRSAKSIQKPGRPLPCEMLPKLKGIPRTRQDYFPNVHIGPVKRWLTSNVGRSWNHVFHKLSERVDTRNPSKDRLRSYVLELVKRHTFVIDGEVWCSFEEQWGEGRFMPINEVISRTPLFFVDPNTGLLRVRAPLKKGPNIFELIEEKHTETRRWIADSVVCVQIRGLWYRCEMELIKDTAEYPPFDAVFKTRIGKIHAQDAYSKPMYCLRKLQLSKSCLKRHRLSNDPNTDTTFYGPELLKRIEGANTKRPSHAAGGLASRVRTFGRTPRIAITRNSVACP